MGRFYKYIRRRENGKYQIRKDGESWGDYANIEDALHDRDILIDSDWDMGEFCARGDVENKYYSMDLPDFDYDDYDYITTRNGEYIIQKRIGKKVKQFGVFDNIEDAIRRRDELIARKWKK